MENGIPTPAEDTYTYLASTWAAPEIEIDGEYIDCYLMQSQVPAEWGKDYAHIYWPDSAIKIGFPEGTVKRPLLEAPSSTDTADMEMPIE